jgi:hypothetical protein
MAIEEDHTSQGGFWNTWGKRWEWHDEQGQWHRVGVPAVIEADGTHWWYLHGELHRIDGPALIEPDGTQYWYVRDRNITEEVLDWMRANAVTWPFNDAHRMEFIMRWA